MPWVGEFGPPTVDHSSKSSVGCVFEQILLFSWISTIFLDLYTVGNA